MTKRIPVWDVRIVASNGAPRVFPVASHKFATELAKAYAGFCPEVTGPHYHLISDEKGLSK